MHDAESESECEFTRFALSCADRIVQRLFEGRLVDPLHAAHAAEKRSFCKSPASCETVSLRISLRRRLAKELRDLALSWGSKDRREKDVGTSEGRRRIRRAASLVHRSVDRLVEHRDLVCSIRSAAIDLRAIAPSAFNDRSRAPIHAWVFVAGPPTSMSTVGVLSSHVAEHDRSHDDRLGRLRRAVRATDGHRVAWLTEGSTSIDSAVRHICRRTHRTSFELALASAATSLGDWFSSMTAASGQACLRATKWHVSPLLLSNDHVGAHPQTRRGYADLLIASLAERVLVLNTRRNSVTEHIVHTLKESVPTRYAPASRVEQTRATRISHSAKAGPAPSSINRPTDIQHSMRVRPPTGEVNSFVFHWTRGRIGAWPDQSTTDYLDEMIWSATLTDRSPLGALARIVTNRMLYASGKLIRGGTRCVCFSAALPDDILRNRTFRPHLRRWDFEPFGIGVRKSSLVEIGGRAVTYGDEATWRQLDQADRPFFQKKRTKSGKRRPIDWSIEQEWRLVGDLDLERLPPDDIIVIVPTETDVASIQSISPWRVIVRDRLVRGYADEAKTTRQID